jgi:putative hemolysin
MSGLDSLLPLLFFISLFLAAFFCSAETAFIGMQKLRVKHLLETGHPKAELINKIVQHPEKFLATVLLGINFFETAVATLGTVMAINWWGENIGLTVATIVVTILTLIIAELVPKSLSARYGEKLAPIYARPIEIASLILYPFVFVLNHIGLRINKMVDDNIEPRPTISTEEFRTAINVGESEGVVKEETAEMLHNVFDFYGRPVREVMVPRPEVIFVEQGSTIDDFFKVYEQSPMTRFPVFHERRDNVIGVLSTKDVLMAQAKGTINPESIIDSLVRPTLFTPDTKSIGELFVEMRDHHHRMAIIIDEFGGVAGVTSMTRLVEEIVGPVGDEITNAEKDYEIINEYTFQIDGGMRVDEANEQMNLDLPLGDYETVAGFVLHLLKSIPKQGEQLKYKNMKIIVTKMTGVKIGEILITKEKVTDNPSIGEKLTPG